jgi:hypothetical protein
MNSVNHTDSEIENHGYTNWPQVVDNIFNNITGKNMEVTYDFDNLQINLPKVTGPDGILVGSAKCEINGKFLISTKVHDNTE